MSFHDKLSEIINNNNERPTIINEKSNFVVITYWWGRGRFNRNTARPCTLFYEDYLNKINNQIIGLITNTITKTQSSKTLNDDEIIAQLFNNKKRIDISLLTIISKMTKHYINDLSNYKNIDEKVVNRFALLREIYPEFMNSIKNPIELSVKLLDIFKIA